MKVINGICSKDAPTNPRGIPYAPFVDKVEDYVSAREEVEGTLKNFQEMISYVACNPCEVESSIGSGQEEGHLTSKCHETLSEEESCRDISRKKIERKN